MITERDLLEAIAECESEPITEKKVDRLATYYTIYDHLFGRSSNESYSHKSVPEAKEDHQSRGDVVNVEEKNEFLKAINGKPSDKVWEVMDELMTETLKIINPRLYDGVLLRLDEI